MRSLLLIILLCITFDLLAQKALTLEDAWQILSENNYSLKQQQKLIEVAKEDISIHKANQYPTISFGSSFRYQSELAKLQLPFALPGSSPETIEAGVKDQYDVSLSITQPIFTGFRTSALIDAVQYKYESQNIKKQVVHNQLALSVGDLFYRAQLNMLQRKVLTESKERANNQLTLIRNMMEADQAIAFDTLEVSTRKMQVISQIQRLQDSYDILLSKISFLLNKRDLPEIEQFKLTEYNPQLPDLEMVKNQALNQRVELRLLDAISKAQIFQKKAIESAYFPQIYANASYHYAKPGVNFFQDDWMDYYAIGINLQWDLWNWGRDRSKVKQSTKQSEQLKLQKDQLIHDIIQQVEKAYLNLKMTKTQIRFQENLVKQEQERYRITKQKYEQSLVSILDLSNAEHSLTASEFELHKEYITWFQNQLLLDFSTGSIVKNILEVSND